MNTRREFLTSAGAALAAAALSPRSVAAAEMTGKLKKAVHLGMIKEKETVDGKEREKKMSVLEKFQLAKELGFDGIELNSPGGFDKDEILKAMQDTGLGVSELIDSVHWNPTHSLSSPNDECRARGVAALQVALQEAKDIGCGSVLLVPGRVDRNVSYADCYTRSQAEIKKAIPAAEKLQVKIAVENVWNNFLLSPLEMARYLDEFNSPWVAAHFDIGNVVKFGFPEQWIRTLGKRIARLHIKEYSREKGDTSGTKAGWGVKLGEGDVDWPAIVKALQAVEYTGWATAEVTGGGRDAIKDIGDRMNKILALV